MYGIKGLPVKKENKFVVIDKFSLKGHRINNMHKNNMYNIFQNIFFDYLLLIILLARKHIAHIDCFKNSINFVKFLYISQPKAIVTLITHKLSYCLFTHTPSDISS